ncbi:WD40 repeat domain-containing protein [Streptomyces gardneri]|uniref:WD40 repeat domain-containing protein n=1 Tax=Streptomyces gardneri TaxID=66892 RepID=UPI0035DBF0A4
MWNLTTGTRSQCFHHGSLCSSLSFSPDSLQLTSASMDKTIRIWNLEVSSPQLQEIPVGVVAISADGSRIATVSREGFSVRDSASGTQVQRFVRGDGAAGQELQFVHPGYGDQAGLLSAAFTATGICFAAATDRQTVDMWDATGALVKRLPTGVRLEELELSPTGHLLATVDRQGIVSVWEVSTGMQQCQLPHHRTHRLVFSPDGSRLATYGRGDGTRVWDSASGAQVAHVRRHSARALAFTPDNSQIAIADRSGGLLVMDVAAEAVVHRFHRTRARAAAFSPDGKYLADAASNTISIWNATTGEHITSMRADSDLESVIWHPGSRAVFTGGRGLLGYEFVT